ncbi:hypothetical protein HF086_002321 [Spodoptera exigua]|uniref:Peptidase C1A papain C-terminal domain-containing protein n=1 Tax=Spodoptera exigua TaxID=7107 RepID=A0A922MVP2_SPOEX|nr:hypothetical protein HF086_002321 [Spodoptera exigua]
MSKQEFAKRMLLKPVKQTPCVSENIDCITNERRPLKKDGLLIADQDAPENFDWRNTKGVIKEVMNQRLCMGCWAFSIVGAIESMSVIQKIDNEHRSIQMPFVTDQHDLDENIMVRQVANHGPLVVAVDATNWQNYIGGVIQRACWYVSSILT